MTRDELEAVIWRTLGTHGRPDDVDAILTAADSYTDEETGPRDNWVALHPHGTRAAYRRHLRREGKPVKCETCLQAERRGWSGRSDELNAARRERYRQARAKGLSSREAKRWRDTAA